ncbi:MAG TPA: hypothetical protein VL490_02655 [Mucilaginibacter sp.]|jgi:hypothetical protein|nr:hypothetical protein [Mucilaginibacter sp.]
MKSLKIIVFIILNIISVIAFAQKLPTEQQVSLRVPANIKVDGKAIEWNNTFQAYNKHVDFYYTMANDDNKLYLAIQATEPAIIRRIINGGVTLTINTSGKKYNKNGMCITYPVFEKNNRFSPMLKNTGIIRMTGVSRPEISTESMMLMDNTGISAKAKFIKTAGIKDIDTLISIYNADGIKAASQFDDKLAYTYELSVDLKKLGLSVNDSDKFSYQLMVNETIGQGINVKKDDSGNITSVSVTKGAIAPQAPTDFWAEYTLARK